MILPKIGELVPDFALMNQHNELIEFKKLKQKSKLVIYFYPKALTPGCTVQACSIRDYAQEFERLNTRVLALSPDTPAKLKKFDTQHTLGFDLLADENHEIAEAYGAWGLKKFMGREFMGIIRTSFIVDEGGKLLKVFEKVKTKTHHEDVITYLKNIS